MFKKIAWLSAPVLMTVVIIVMASGFVQAQENVNAPLYVRFCDDTRLGQGTEPIAAELNGAISVVEQFDAFIQNYEVGAVTALQGISETQAFLDAWNQAPKPFNCLAPYYGDINQALSELLISMLYWETGSIEQRDIHFQNARVIMDRIRNDSTNSVAYLDANPVTQPEPLVVTATPNPEDEVVEEEPVEEETASELRTSEELSAILNTYLLENNITVLRNVAVQAFPDDTFIVIQLDQFTADDGTTFDYENTVFTFNVLAAEVTTWPELDDISRIIIETYADEERVFYVESNGDNFRARYATDTLSQEDFETALVINPAETE